MTTSRGITASFGCFAISGYFLWQTRRTPPASDTEWRIKSWLGVGVFAALGLIGLAATLFADDVA